MVGRCVDVFLGWPIIRGELLVSGRVPSMNGVCNNVSVCMSCFIHTILSVEQFMEHIPNSP